MKTSKSESVKLVTLFLAPAVIIWLAIIIIPFLYGIVISFSDWNGIATTFNFNGIANYIKIFNDRTFIDTLVKTFGYTLAVVIISNVMGLLLGQLLTSAIKGRNLLRTLIFTPNVTGGIILGYIWKFIFNFGIPAIGIALSVEVMKKSWLTSSDKAFWAMIIVASWQLSSYLMIIYIAGLTNVPKELPEAAKIDGASKLQVFRHVTLPMIRPSITICLFLSITRCFMSFDINVALTNGGPFNSTELIAFKIYRTAFTSMDFGVAQAQAIVLFVVVVIISLTQVYFTQKREVQM